MEPLILCPGFPGVLQVVFASRCTHSKQTRSGENSGQLLPFGHTVWCVKKAVCSSRGWGGDLHKGRDRMLAGIIAQKDWKTQGPKGLGKLVGRCSLLFPMQVALKP